MTNLTPFISDSYRAVVDGLVRIHLLALSGQFESEQADALRDEMDEPWAALLPEEVDRLSGLSEDLNAIQEVKVDRPAVEPNPQSRKNLSLADDARLKRQWDRSLSLYRRWYKYLPALLSSYVRGSIWREAGEPKAAAAFFEHAWSLRPGDQMLLASLLNVLKDADSDRATQMAIDVLDRHVEFIRPVVAYAAETILRHVPEAIDPESEKILHRICSVLEDTLQTTPDRNELDRSFSNMELTLLAMCYVRLRRRNEAHSLYSKLIARQPSMPGLYVARADLSIGSKEDSIADYEKSVRLGTEVDGPYLVLADHYLKTKRYKECLGMCELGLKTRTTQKVKSIFHEIRAIAMACSNYPRDAVRRSFETAMLEYPGNHDASENLSRYEEIVATASPAPQTWANLLTAEHWRQEVESPRRYETALPVPILY